MNVGKGLLQFGRRALGAGGRLAAALAIVHAVLPGPPVALAATAAYAWPEFDGSGQHGGNNTSERTITTGNVGRLQLLFRHALPGTADGAPAYLNNVKTPLGIKDLLFVTTKAGDIVAIDAHSGAQVWIDHNPAGSCKINNGSTTCYTTSSPAVDPNQAYVYSYGLDGYVHKYAVGDGSEIKIGGWPELATLKPWDEKGSSALTIATTTGGVSYLYVANGGYPGDNGDYQGHITAIKLSDGTSHVFNTLCSDQTVHFSEGTGSTDCSNVQSAVWARSGVVYDAGSNKIYFATGNGLYTGVHNWGDSVLALNPDGTGVNGGPLDSFTPSDYQYLQNTDTDLGSTAPAILPVPPTSVVQHLGLQGGKGPSCSGCSGVALYLLNLDNLSSQSGGPTPGHLDGYVGSPINVPQGGQVLTTPATWTNPADNSTWAFVANGSGISGIKLIFDAHGNPSLSPVWTDHTGGTSPLVANGVLYYAASGTIYALDPLTGNVLWSDSSIGGIHWQSPVVANGVLYIEDGSSNLTAYTLPFSPLTLTRGWNMLGIPSSSYTSASGLAAEISSQNSGLTVGTIATYQHGRFVLYIPGYSADLSLHPGQGVDVYTSSSGIWTPQGKPLGPTTTAIGTGWNLISVPYPDPMTASSICAELTASGQTCRQVAIYQNGTYTVYLPAGGGTDFTVGRDQGFMVLTQSGGAWTAS